MATPLLTTREVAKLIAMSEDWVREHAVDLGGIRAGASPRAPLRFELDDIEAWKERQRLAKPALAKARRRPGPRRAPAGVTLLPIPTRRLTVERAA
jgi:hypothetical protein